MSTKHVSIRLDEGTMARVDALALDFSTEWRAATRSDVLRELIHTALELYERREGRSPGASKGGSEKGGSGTLPRRGRRPKRDG